MAEMSNPVDVMGRELPYSQEAELAVIGSALTNSHSVAEYLLLAISYALWQ
mgnify:CR=1 FL=1